MLQGGRFPEKNQRTEDPRIVARGFKETPVEPLMKASLKLI